MVPVYRKILVPSLLSLMVVCCPALADDDDYEDDNNEMSNELLGSTTEHPREFVRIRENYYYARDARDIARIRVRRSPDGFFFRGDSRPPRTSDGNGVFQLGFIPQGVNRDLHAHLSFRGDSAYVSTSRSDLAARNYIYGRTGSRHVTGYLYVIAPGRMRGFWIPGIFPRDQAVQNNHEFAVLGRIERSYIAGAFRYVHGNDDPVEWIPNPDYAFDRESPYHPSTDGYFQDICSSIALVAYFLCLRPDVGGVDHSFM